MWCLINVCIIIIYPYIEIRTGILPIIRNDNGTLICTWLFDMILILPFFSGDGLSSESSLNMNFTLAALALQMKMQQCGTYQHNLLDWENHQRNHHQIHYIIKCKTGCFQSRKSNSTRKVQKSANFRFILIQKITLTVLKSQILELKNLKKKI